MSRDVGLELMNRRTPPRLIGPRIGRDVSKCAARVSGAASAVPRVVGGGGGGGGGGGAAAAFVATAAPLPLLLRCCCC